MDAEHVVVFFFFLSSFFVFRFAVVLLCCYAAVLLCCYAIRRVGDCAKAKSKGLLATAVGRRLRRTGSYDQGEVDSIQSRQAG